MVLKILPSSSKPHQYKHIFYKRLSDGNEPMNVTEIRQIMLESQKQSHNETLLISELSLNMRYLESTKTSLIDGGNDFGALTYLDITSTIHFQHHLSYVYPIKLPTALASTIEEVTKLKKIPNDFYHALNDEPPEHIIEDAKNEDYDKPKQFIIDMLITGIDNTLNAIIEISNLLNRKILKTEILHPKKS